ncbi:MAG: hypothetical protein HWD59_00300 [Coxiellaceae bacterium]|nr:MAG: hypothetical protein HWD59_00300 [Coxiellaceae bacterium]
MLSYSRYSMPRISTRGKYYVFSNVIYGHQRNQIKNWRRQWSQVTYSNTTMPQEITTVIDKWKQTLGQPRKTGTLIDINRSLPLFFKDGVEQKPNQKAFNDFLKGYFNGVDQTDDYVNFLANNAGQKMQRLLIMILSGKLCLNVNGDSRQVNVGATTFCVEWHFNNNKELYCYVKLNVVSILDTKTYYEMDIKGHIFEKEIEIMTPGKYEKRN